MHHQVQGHSQDLLQGQGHTEQKEGQVYVKQKEDRPVHGHNQDLLKVKDI